MVGDAFLSNRNKLVVALLTRTAVQSWRAWFSVSWSSDAASHSWEGAQPADGRRDRILVVLAEFLLGGWRRSQSRGVAEERLGACKVRGYMIWLFQSILNLAAGVPAEHLGSVFSTHRPFPAWSALSSFGSILRRWGGRGR